MPLYRPAGGGVIGSETVISGFPAVRTWAPDTNYQANELVRYNRTGSADPVAGGLYQRINAGTSGTTFDPTNWLALAAEVPGPAGPTPAPAAYIRPYTLLPTYLNATDTVSQVSVVGSPVADVMRTMDRDTSHVRVQAVANDIDSTHAGFLVSLPAFTPSDPTAELIRVDVVTTCRTENGTFAEGQAAQAWDNGNGDPSAAQLFEIAVVSPSGAVTFSITEFTYTDNVYHERTKRLVTGGTDAPFGAVPTKLQVSEGLRLRFRRIQSIGVADKHMRFTSARVVCYYQQAVTT